MNITPLPTIPFEKLSILAGKVADLNKRGERLGLEPMRFEACEFWRKRTVDRQRIIQRLWSIEFIGEAPRYKGHAFVAVLAHHAAGNLIARSPFADVELTEWQNAGPRCQHCGLLRNRKETYLVRTPDGGLIQLGGDCMVDYLGTTDAAEAVRVWALWAELRGFCDDEDGDQLGGGIRSEILTLDYVACAMSAVRRLGFHKSSEEQSTRSDADFAAGKCPEDKGRKGDKALVQAWTDAQPKGIDVTRAAEAFAWLASNRDNSDYMHNLRVATSEPIVGERMRGILASVPAAFDRHQGIERERAARPANPGHFGAEGDKIESLQVEVVFSRGYVNDFGSGTILVMRAESGHVFKCFASGAAGQIEDYAGTWFIRGSVKRHETDKHGEPVTLLSRMKIDRAPFPVKKARKARVAKPPVKLAYADRCPGCGGTPHAPKWGECIVAQYEEKLSRCRLLDFYVLGNASSGQLSASGFFSGPKRTIAA